MSKSTKKLPPTGTRPISDFFTRKSATVLSSSSLPPPLPSVPQPSRHSKPLKYNASNSRVAVSGDPDAALSGPKAPTGACLDALDIVSPPRTPRSTPLPPILIQHSQSLGSRVTASFDCVAGHSQSKQRKTKFDSDSDLEQPGSVVYVTKTPSSQVTPRAQKKPRLLSSDPSVQASANGIVPSSQSPSELPGQQTTRFQKHENETPPRVLPPHFNPCNELSMDINMNTPPCLIPGGPTAPPSLSSPMPLDSVEKAARIIAEIKAKAYADTLTNRSYSPTVDFRETLSDSSDDECLLLSQGKERQKNDPKTPVFNESLTSIQASKRLRCNISPSPSALPSPLTGSSRPSRRTRVASTRTPTILTTQTKNEGGAKGKAHNPLDELLKEKKLADQRGNSDEAFRQAEAAVNNKGVMLQAIDDLTNEESARMAVSGLKPTNIKSSSPPSHESEDEETVLNQVDRQRWFGEEQGKAIGDMLEADKVERQNERESERVVGIPLWQVHSLDSMEVDQPAHGMDCQHPVLSLLACALENKDITEATLLVSSGALVMIEFVHFPDVIPYLCELALSSHEPPLTSSCTRLLAHIWDHALLPMSAITFSVILTTLMRLGANSSVLESVGWTPTPGVRSTPAAIQQRTDIICRLIVLLTSAARSRNLVIKEVPDILMALILIANDTSSSADLQRGLMLAIDEICRSVASGADISVDIEPTICTKIVQYAAALEPVNKAFIVSLLGSGTGRTKRIARWVAHGIITDARAIYHECYGDLPNLSPVLTQLARRQSHLESSSAMPGKFEQHDKTDFVDMGLYIQILGVAITNIPGYVMEEGKTVQSNKEPLLLIIRMSLERLHSSISDIRATHLDRSRTKAALKELSLRIYYQRWSAKQSASTLHSYFGKPRNKKQG